MDTIDPAGRRRLENRIRILTALARALEDRATVLDLVGEAEDRERARAALMARYGWDDVEATAVLDLQFVHTVRGRRKRVAEELRELRAQLEAIP